MQQHLPHVDTNKLHLVLEIKEAYQQGKLSLKEARRRLKEEIKTLRPYEIALAEQQLKAIDEDECRKENIQQMMLLFEEIMDTSRPDLPDSHPIMCYIRENDHMRKLLLSVEDLVQYPVIKNQWLELYDEIAKWRVHLSRKQNQLYSTLERKGFDRPTTTMWLLDDFIRDEIKDARLLLEEDKDDEFIALQATIVADIRDLMQKEESILYPTSLAMILPKEFEEMKLGDREIGFAWIEEPNESISREADSTSSTGHTPTDLIHDLAQLLGKYGGKTFSENGLLDVCTGKLTLEQINLIYKHLPVDLSYVDENELVRFYSDTSHRVFPRSKNVIGRDVKNCHPRTSVHLVEEIIEKFRSGEQDSVDFWINKPGLFIYIYYVAVRDTEGRFRGVLEMMQDCTRIRNLEGSRTLLTWDNDSKGQKINDPSEAYSSSSTSSEEDNQLTNRSPTHLEQEKTSTNIELEPHTRIKPLLERYPSLKDELPKINKAFEMLQSPLARIMLPKATIRMMAERSEMEINKLIEALHTAIQRIES